MNNRTRLGSVVLAIALAASACGSTTSEVDADAQAQIDALQERIDELTVEEDAPVVSSTTAAPEVTETPEPSEPAAKTTTTALEAEVVEPEPEPAAVAVTPEAIDGFAIPEGSVLDSSMGSDEISALVRTITGPTNNAAGQFARIAPFPAVSTLPDTVIEGFSYNVYFEPRSDADEQHHTYKGEFTTSVLPADVIVAYKAELAAITGKDTAEGTQDNNGTEVYWTQVGPQVGGFEVVAYKSRGVTVVTIKHTPEWAPLPAEQVDAVAGLTADLPTPDVAQLDQVSINTDVNFTVRDTFRVRHVVDEATEDEMFQTGKDWSAAAGWTIASERDTVIDYEAPELSARRIATSVQAFSFETSGTWAIHEVSYDYSK